MKKLIISLGALFLVSSCALQNSSTQQIKDYDTACIAFNSTVNEATALIKNHKLSYKKAKEIQFIVNSIAPLCEQKLQNSNNTEKIINGIKTIKSYEGVK